jgi:hypothetical protein
MNTGGGKTVVGLMILKSCLNEGIGPVVYVTPDNYLVAQVRSEANLLGIETTEDPMSNAFRRGRAILVVNIHKIVNGLSVFGVEGDQRTPIELGTVLVDDVHACLSTVDEQFSLVVPAAHTAYPKLLALFRADLEDQSLTLARDIGESERSAVLQVPYWAWADREKQVLDILYPERGTDQLKFNWPLVAGSLSLCSAAVTADGFEIRPPCPPIERIPSLVKAKRRVFLTATLPDDSVLVTHFGATAVAAENPITPKTADDIGDRMILVPSDFLPEVADDDLRRFLKDQSSKHNVVVIVPSDAKARTWSDVADATHNKATIQVGVDQLKAGHVGLVVLVNKYDGIDLPRDACRILVLDSLPEAYGALDRIEAAALGDSEVLLSRQIQRIEQGMGRGVRSNDDYCVVILMGRRLTARLNGIGAMSRFSPATRVQLDLSQEVSDLLRGGSLGDLAAAIDQCLGRDTAWVTASKARLDGVKYPESSTVPPSALAEREAFDLAVIGQFATAVKRLEEATNAETDIPLKSWLKQRAASYLHRVDKVAAQQLQLSAKLGNRALLKPMAGIQYERVTPTAEQSVAMVKYLSARYTDGAALVVGVAALLESLKFDRHAEPSAVSAFEQAMCDLGSHLGFLGQRPERDFGEGPDVLWSLGGLEYLVIECKSAVTEPRISKSDAAQLSHSVDWFVNNYDKSCTVTPVLVHLGNMLRDDATAREGSRVIHDERLTALRAAVTQVTVALARNNQYRDEKTVAGLLVAHGFSRSAFIQKWAVAPRGK